MADEFQVLIDSLGNTSVGYLGNVAESVRITWNPTVSTALLNVHLREDGWAARQEAMDRLAPVREMFMDELALDFVFEACDDGNCHEESDQESRDFVAA